ncbi:AKT-interacting protein [Hetaerina americana]|uniref:AKT-interacting protein n=1 Tax=Hetaerina americana TaxID=62018 RepID=UPI003A7F5E41
MMASGARGKVQSDDSEMSSGFKRQGSLRKVLPPFTTVDDVGSTSIVKSSAAKMIDRPPSSVSDNKSEFTVGGIGKETSNGIELLVSQEYNIISEYHLVLKRAIPGMYIIPSANSAFLWFGVIFIHDGVYQGGVFRFQLRIPNTYPSIGFPDFIFEKPLFHPRVDSQTGVLAFKDTLDETDAEEKRLEISERPMFGTSNHCHQSKHIWQILLAAQCAILKVETNNPLNEEAAEMYRNDAEVFAQKVAESVKQSLEHINDPTAINDPHYFVFQEYDEQIHEPYRRQLLRQLPSENNNSSSSSTVGLSWVQPGTLLPFSKKLSFL